MFPVFGELLTYYSTTTCINNQNVISSLGYRLVFGVVSRTALAA